ncbi:transcription termination factor 2 [Pyricularia oryzae]|nr:hypothetical protein MCOR08_006490 [Pyricularia oryzae]KAI7922621.1 transcription termination factor 2 [Pyricularia oryzae]KAI7924894.1 transcription termination factor 2 [Pyricularia oryzae]QBZ57253.1 hypothetical protein PoMZ_02177 [Pyricularia oryzae]
MAPNGTGIANPAPFSPASHLGRHKRARSESAERSLPVTPDPTRNHSHSDTEISYSDSAPKGRPMFAQAPPQNTMSWDPKALLNPKAAPQSSGSTQRPGHTGRVATSHGNAPQAFQFASPNEPSISIDLTDSDDTHEDQRGHGHTQAAGNGMGAMIERANNVESRADIPQTKRRKIEVTNTNGQGTPIRGGSGMLGSYIKGQELGDGGASTPARSPQTTVDLTDVNESDAASTDPGLVEVCFGMLEVAVVNCHTVPHPRPNGVALGGNDYWPPIKTVLRRMVNDTATANVMVYDHTRQVFGSLDQKTAVGLVPLLDSAVLQFRTDCRIPSRRKQPGEVPGEPISKAYKIEITLFGRRKYSRTVGRILRERGLRLINPSIVPRGIKLHNPHLQFPIPAAAPSAPARPVPSNAYSQYTPAPTQRSVEEVRADVYGVFDDLNSDSLPLMEPGPNILTELLPHQKQGLAFMTARETPDENKLPALWKERYVHGGHMEYYNVVTQQSEVTRPTHALGGILADMMGLGKTLSILSLISSSMDQAAEWATRVPQQPVQERRKQTSNKFKIPMQEPLGLTKLTRNSKATLLVCPLSTVTNWEEQIKQHVKPDTLSYYIYHGQNRTKDPAVLANYDLVITTYGSVSSELTARHKRRGNQYPLEEIGWFRVVLDEAHMIREQATLQFKAICRLQANRRWAVTGTPVQNRLDDLAALLAFIRLKPFDDRNKFNQHIVTPFKLADPEIIDKLRALVDSITLRRLKDRIHLPPRTDNVVKLTFSPEEQRLYDLFARNAKDRVQALTGTRERILGGKTYIHILQSILRLRLICAHGKDLLSEDDLKAVEGMTQDSAIDLDSDDDSDKPQMTDSKAYRTFDLMKETNNDACVACQRKLGSNNEETDLESERQEDILGYLTPCFHLYCLKCIHLFRDEERGVGHSSDNHSVGECPNCHQMVKFICNEIRRTRADAEHEVSHQEKAKGHTVKSMDDYTGPHTKTRALVEDLLSAKAHSELMPDEPPIKSVVFSGWTSHLDLIEIALDKAGITHTRLDGKMSRLARTQAMDRFREDPSVHVILVSIMAGGLGLNLTAGNHVYVMEPQYNPAAEAQAVDRVHRLGQKRPVRIIRYIMENSFEEQMVALQQKKIKLANLSMDRGESTGPSGVDKREAARQRLMDLKDLFK